MDITVKWSKSNKYNKEDTMKKKSKIKIVYKKKRMKIKQK